LHELDQWISDRRDRRATAGGFDIDAQLITALWAVEVSHRDRQWCGSSLVTSKPIDHSEPRCPESAAAGATPAIELGHDGDKRCFVIFAEGPTQTGIDPGTAELDQPPTEPGVINADQNGPVILVVSEGARPGQEIGVVVEDDEGPPDRDPPAGLTYRKLI
jgi:hypothetical protein